MWFRFFINFTYQGQAKIQSHLARSSRVGVGGVMCSLSRAGEAGFAGTVDMEGSKAAGG